MAQVLQSGIMGASVGNQRTQVLQWGIIGTSKGQQAQVLQGGTPGSPVGDQRARILQSTGLWFCGPKPLRGRGPLAINGVKYA